MAERRVVVTGAGSGIGAAIARAFVEAGDRAALLDLDGAAAAATAAEIDESGASVLARACDVTRPADCESAVRDVLSAWGGIDVLVVNAGITHVGSVRETEVDVLRRVMEVNFFGAVHATKAALPSLLACHGHVVVLSSVAGFAPLATRAGYAASKHALEGFFASLRAEHRADGLRVTLVCPAFVHTRIGERTLGPAGEAAGAGARTGVRGEIEPEVVAAAVLRGVARGRRRVIVPGQARLAWWISRLAPGAYEALMARRMRTR